MQARQQESRQKVRKKTTKLGKTQAKVGVINQTRKYARKVAKNRARRYANSKESRKKYEVCGKQVNKVYNKGGNELGTKVYKGTR